MTAIKNTRGKQKSILTRFKERMAHLKCIKKEKSGVARNSCKIDSVTLDQLGIKAVVDS